MFHEEFILHAKEEDPAAEYLDDDAKLVYYLPHIYDIDALIETIDHEWKHALFQWAVEEEWSVDGDHYIMRQLGFD